MRQWINDKLMTNGKLISKRLNEKWFISNGYAIELNALKQTHLNLTIACKKELGLVQTCKCCAETVISPREYCSSECANKSLERASKISNAWKDGSVNNSRKLTMVGRFGVESIFHLPKVQERVRSSVAKKYQVSNISQLDSVKKKKEEVRSTWTEEYKTSVYEKITHDWTREHYTDELTTEIENKLANVTGVSDPVFDCVKSLSTVYRLLNEYRPELIKKGVSSGHQEILRLLESLDIEYEVNNRSVIKPFELDVYIPSMNLAFEYNGTYWHSSEKIDKKYHQRKSLLAKDNGIRLVHLYEYDGLESNLSIVRKQVSKLSRREYARNCKVMVLDKKVAKQFIKDNHRAGYARSSLFYGLFKDGELLQVMTLSKPRFNKKYEYELIRMCSLSGVTVLGGAGKLFKFFVNEIKPTSVISYSSLDNGFNTVYEKIGFEYKDITDPSYVWVSNTEKLSRYQTQMKCENTEMANKGFLKVYNAGNELFTWNFV
jgi:hypothetical protein